MKNSDFVETGTLNEGNMKNKNDIIRWGLTLALGMLVILWRVVLPTNIEITIGIIILVAVLDIFLTAALVLLNRNELKEIVMKEFTISIKDFGKIILCFAIVFIIHIISWNELIYMITGSEKVLAQAPVAWVGSEFSRIFPLGIFISTVIAAPIWEEIALRMAGRNLIKNKALFVLITTILFVFIHTGFALATGVFYATFGISIAIIYLITKDLRIVIGVHFMWNLMGNIYTLT